MATRVIEKPASFGRNKIAIYRSRLFRSHYVVKCEYVVDGFHHTPWRQMTFHGFEQAIKDADLHIQLHKANWSMHRS